MKAISKQRTSRPDGHELSAQLVVAPGSWLNMAEIFFSIITRQAICRGSFTSVKDLIAAIEIFISGWNDRCQPSSGPSRRRVTPALPAR